MRTSQETVEAFERSIQDGWKGEVDLSEVLSHLHPEVEVIEAASLPYSGIWKGHEGFLELASYFQRTWHFPPGKTFQYVADGGEVVVLTHGTAVAKTTGTAIEWRLAEHFTVRDGLIVQIRPYYYDTAAIAAAIEGPAEQ